MKDNPGDGDISNSRPTRSRKAKQYYMDEFDGVNETKGRTAGPRANSTEKKRKASEMIVDDSNQSNDVSSASSVFKTPMDIPRGRGTFKKRKSKEVPMEGVDSNGNDASVDCSPSLPSSQESALSLVASQLISSSFSDRSDCRVELSSQSSSSTPRGRRSRSVRSNCSSVDLSDKRSTAGCSRSQSVSSQNSNAMDIDDDLSTTNQSSVCLPSSMDESEIRSRVASPCSVASSGGETPDDVRRFKSRLKKFRGTIKHLSVEEQAIAISKWEIEDKERQAKRAAQKKLSDQEKQELNRAKWRQKWAKKRDNQTGASKSDERKSRNLELEELRKMFVANNKRRSEELHRVTNPPQTPSSMRCATDDVPTLESQTPSSHLSNLLNSQLTLSYDSSQQDDSSQDETAKVRYIVDLPGSNVQPSLRRSRKHRMDRTRERNQELSSNMQGNVPTIDEDLYDNGDDCHDGNLCMTVPTPGSTVSQRKDVVVLDRDTLQQMISHRGDLPSERRKNLTTSLTKFKTKVMTEEQKDFSNPVNLVPPCLDLGEPAICPSCEAITYTLNCCMSGDVQIPPPLSHPHYIKKLLTGTSPVSEHVRKEIVSYNSAFALGSISYNREKGSAGQPFVKVNGMLHHQLAGAAVPHGKSVPLFHQVYKYDVNEAMKYRQMNPVTGNTVLPNIVRNLQHLLEEKNYLVKQYKTAVEIMGESIDRNDPMRNVFLVLRSPAEVGYKGMLHPGTISRPKQELESILYTLDEDGAPPKHGLCIVHRQSGGRLEEVGYWNALVDPISYPLLFPYGNAGYRSREFKKRNDYVTGKILNDEFDKDEFPYSSLGDEMELKPEAEAAALVDSLTPEQRGHFNRILKAVETNGALPDGNCFFLQGSGGCGKTYLYRALYYHLQTKDIPVAMIATTGIAATLLIKGSTCHRKFMLRLNCEEGSSSMMQTHTGPARELAKLSVFIIDESTMASKHMFEAIHKLLCDITGIHDRPFGGKVMLLGGDWKQLLPVVPGQSSLEATFHSLKRSSLWSHFRVLTLTKNMRAQRDPQYSTLLENIGNGLVNGIPDLDVLPDPNCVALSSEEIIKFIYGDIAQDPRSVAGSCVLASLNRETEEINEQVLRMLPGHSRTYRAIDSPNDLIGMQVCPEYFEDCTPTGMPPFNLTLKEGAIVILLRNLNVSDGLCNGSRLMIRKMHDHFVECELLTTDHAGTVHWISPIKLQAAGSGKDTPKFKRFQLPFRLAYALTINKSQGQTFDRVGIVLNNNVFSHGQLYVAMSRVRQSDNVRLFSAASKMIGDRLVVVVKNKVERSVLEAVDTDALHDPHYVSPGSIDFPTPAAPVKRKSNFTHNLEEARKHQLFLQDKARAHEKKQEKINGKSS